MAFEEYVYVDESSPSGLRWKVGGGKRKKDGVAGTLDGDSYWKVWIAGQCCLAHRVIYEMCSGAPIPEGLQIDHFDTNKANNTYSNFRAVTHAKNGRNVKQISTNTSGHTGVSLSVKAGGYAYWVAYWTEGGKSRAKTFSILRYGHDTAFQLALAYRQAQITRMNADGAGYTEHHGDKR